MQQRRSPPGQLFDVLTEHREIKVRRVYGTSDGEHPGVPAMFVMSYVAGESYEPALTAAEPTVTIDELRQRAHVAVQMAVVVPVRCQ